MNLKPLIAFCLAIVLLTGCTRLEVLNATVSHGGYVRYANLSYGPLPRQKLDVYRPKKIASAAKVVIFFYGGSWRTGNKKDYRFVAKALTSRGFVAVLPNYRVYPAVTFPAFVQDGAAAARWVSDNTSKFGGDPNHIYLMGHSAGAHIAALLTLDGHYLKDVGLDRSVIRATAGLSGPYDFVPNAADRQAFGLQPGDSTRQIEPINFVDGREPPMLLIQGLRDKVVAPDNAFNLAARIRQAGGGVTCITYPKRGHASIVLALDGPFRWLAPVLDDVTTYFDRH